MTGCRGWLIRPDPGTDGSQLLRFVGGFEFRSGRLRVGCTSRSPSARRTLSTDGGTGTELIAKKLMAERARAGLDFQNITNFNASPTSNESRAGNQQQPASRIDPSWNPHPQFAGIECCLPPAIPGQDRNTDKIRPDQRRPHEHNAART